MIFHFDNAKSVVKLMEKNIAQDIAKAKVTKY